MAQNPCTMEPFVESRWQHIMFDPSTGYGPACWSKILSHTGGLWEASHQLQKNDLDLMQWWMVDSIGHKNPYHKEHEITHRLTNRNASF